MPEAWSSLVRKYEPKTYENFVGNRKIVERTREFLKSWIRKKPEKALLFVGPPGIGKTLLAYVMANEFSLQLFEINASDERSKRLLEGRLLEASQNTGLYGRLRLILIDEVDGLSSTDRQAVPTIIKIIKESKNPVVLTANDDYAKQVRPLRAYTEVLKFTRPDYREIFSFLRRVAVRENIEFNEDALLVLARNTSGDVRAALEDLEMLKPFGVYERSLGFLGTRQRSIKIFDALSRIFFSTEISKNLEVLNSLDLDKDSLIAWVEENIHAFEDLEKAGEKLSRADLFNGRIITRQYWGFLRFFYAVLASLPQDNKTKYMRFMFPSILSKMARTREARQTRKNIASKIAKKTHTSTKDVLQNFSFFQILFSSKELAPYLTEYLDLSLEELSFVLPEKEEKTIRKILDASLEIRKKRISRQITEFSRAGWEDRVKNF